MFCDGRSWSNINETVLIPLVSRGKSHDFPCFPLQRLERREPLAVEIQLVARERFLACRRSDCVHFLLPQLISPKYPSSKDINHWMLSRRRNGKCWKEH